MKTIPTPNHAITFVTGNIAKVAELQQYCSQPIAHYSCDLPELQSLDLEEIVADKAERAFSLVQTPVIVEDTSLVFTALGKLPGPLIKWFIRELGVEGICTLLSQYEDRTAVASVLYGYYDGKQLQTFVGMTPGTIAREPRGNNGFGWDSIFIPDGSPLTWGEVAPFELKAHSMRQEALLHLQEKIFPSVGENTTNTTAS